MQTETIFLMDARHAMVLIKIFIIYSGFDGEIAFYRIYRLNKTGYREYIYQYYSAWKYSVYDEFFLLFFKKNINFSVFKIKLWAILAFLNQNPFKTKVEVGIHGSFSSFYSI